MRKIFLGLLLAASAMPLAAQSQTPAEASKSEVSNSRPVRKITGRIVDEQGEPLTGANVSVKGTTDKALADIDGNYSISTSAEMPVLIISYMGLETKEVSAAGKEVVDVVLAENTAELDEVVVTALGIKREKKLLGYAVQDISSDRLNLTGDPSVTSALSGKIAGVEMNTASTGLAGSTKITIRGNSSLTDNNQPLWVVDGVPFSDDQSSSVTAYGGYDRGGTVLDLNPEDIESISVLKGPNAAALYGARAGNGVILVTTKKGAAGKGQGLGVTYSGSFTWSKAAQTIKLQNKYGQGSGGAKQYVYDDEGNPLYMTGENSFGPLLDGAPDLTWNGTTIPYQAYGNKLTDYFRTGFSHFHTVALGKQTDQSHFRLSFGFNDNRGMFEDEKLNKINIDLNAGQKLTSWFSVDGKVSLSRTKADNRPQTGLGGEVGQLLVIPANIRLSDLKQYSTELRPHQNWFGPDQHYSNPYYIRHQLQNSDERLRAFGYFSANLDIKTWLKFQAKYAFDFYRTKIKETNLGLADQAITTGTDTWQSKLTEDTMNRSETNHFEHNISAMFLGDYSFNDDWRLGYTLGGNIMYRKNDLLSASVQNLLQKDTWIFNTAEKLNSATDGGSDRAMYSIFASAQVAFREYLSLDLTARNDWSSTLPASNRSFFYPSASLSYVFSDCMKDLGKPLPKWVTFSKLRLSWAQVGKDPDPYNLYNTLQYSFSNGQRQSTVQTIKMNDNLKPEIKSSFEVGLDMKFLDNRLGFDFTYYYNVTKNQAMLVDASSPWSQQWVNAGKISNKGIEFTLYTTPVKTKDFQFDLNLNLSHNVSRVDELADGVGRIYFAGDSHMPIKVGAVTGGKLGDIYANKLMQRDAAGNPILDANGLPQPEAGGGNQEQWLLDHPIGNIQPKVLMSLMPSFNYKGIILAGMFDAKIGGDIVSVSEGMATMVGTSQRTLDRDFPNAQRYYQTIGLYSSEQGYAEEFVHDASYIKLKELSLGYDFPKQWLRKCLPLKGDRSLISSLRLSFVARNLCFLMKNAPGNPEGGYDTSMFSQALDFLAVPYARTYGLTINIGL